MLGDRAATLGDEHAHTTLPDRLLVREWYLRLAHSPATHLGDIVIVRVVHHGLAKDLLTVLEHLLLNDVLFQDLVVELEWLLIDKLVIESFAVCWLDDVALRVHTVLVALLSRLLVLTLELLLLLHRVIVMLH